MNAEKYNVDTNISDNYKVTSIKIIFSTSQKKHLLNKFSEEIFIINLITNKLRRNYIMILMKKLKRCKAELSVINCFKSFENSNKTKNKDTETVVLWFKRPWF